jgi:CRP/FNR family transcriptional regulator, anaerobic regulatory protein
MTALAEYIIAHFGYMPAADLEKIVSLFTATTVKKGDYLLKAGKRCDKLSFVQSGFLRIFVLLDDREVTQWISSKGYFATDLSSFQFETPARWNIQALEDTEIYTITKTDYKKISDLVTQWQEIEKLFLVRCFTILEERIFSHLAMSAAERYHVFFEHNSELFNQVPLQHLASMLGMTPETFSRIRKKR